MRERGFFSLLSISGPSCVPSSSFPPLPIRTDEEEEDRVAAGETFAEVLERVKGAEIGGFAEFGLTKEWARGTLDALVFGIFGHHMKQTNGGHGEGQGKRWGVGACWGVLDTFKLDSSRSSPNCLAKKPVVDFGRRVR